MVIVAMKKKKGNGLNKSSFNELGGERGGGLYDLDF